MDNLICFLPCRKGSERVLNKNTKPFANNKSGLIEIKLKQLINVTAFDKIVVSTDDQCIIDIALSLNHEKIFIDRRPKSLATSETTTDSLIKYVAKILNCKHILWTHVTSPFIDENYYNKAIEIYRSNQGSFDSLMSVTNQSKFLWSEDAPINYDRSIEKWPRTQTLKPIYEINSGIFISSLKNYYKFEDRIGLKPFMFELPHNIAFDIDWPIDFKIAEIMWELENHV